MVYKIKVKYSISINSLAQLCDQLTNCVEYLVDMKWLCGISQIYK